MRLNEILKALDKRKITYTVEKETERDIKYFSSLFHYKEETITFIVPERQFHEYKEEFIGKSISLIIIGDKEQLYDCFDGVIRVTNPRKAFFAIVEECFDTSDDETITGISGNPEWSKKYSYIAPNVVLGKNVKIGIGCVIEGNVEIGDDTEIHHNVVIRNKTRIGKRCTIHSGVIIGEYGFGYTRNEKNEKTMLKHYGGVVIEDDVHIGDNSVIIRGAIDDTIIHHGTKLNTMVHVAHNNEIGENTLVTSPMHFCGSVKVGKECHIAGLIIRNQCEIGDSATVGLGAVVVKNVESETVVIGNPAKSMTK